MRLAAAPRLRGLRVQLNIYHLSIIHHRVQTEECYLLDVVTLPYNVSEGWVCGNDDVHYQTVVGRGRLNDFFGLVWLYMMPTGIASKVYLLRRAWISSLQELARQAMGDSDYDGSLASVAVYPTPQLESASRSERLLWLAAYGSLGPSPELHVSQSIIFTP